MKARILILILLASIAQAEQRMSTEPIVLTFPDLPTPYITLMGRSATPATASVLLPDGFDPEQSYPMLLLLSGGPGGEGREAPYFQPFLRDQSWILVNMTTFRDPTTYLDETKWQIQQGDGPFAWAATRLMLEKLATDFPQIDWKRSAVVGISNGGHLLSLWMNDPKFEVGDWFRDFVFAESGRRYTGGEHLPENARVLFVLGDQAERYPANIEVVQREQAKAPDRIASLIMPEVGHEFPPKYRRKVIEWLESSP